MSAADSVWARVRLCGKGVCVGSHAMSSAECGEDKYGDSATGRHHLNHQKAWSQAQRKGAIAGSLAAQPDTADVFVPQQWPRAHTTQQQHDKVSKRTGTGDAVHHLPRKLHILAHRPHSETRSGLPLNPRRYVLPSS